MSQKVYWTMRDGTKVDVDAMDVNNLRNTLKMLIRSANNIAIQRAKHRAFEINEELAQEDASNHEISESTDISPQDLDDDIFSI